MSKDLSPSPFVGFPGGLHGSPVLKILPSNAPVVGLICSLQGLGFHVPCGQKTKTFKKKKKQKQYCTKFKKDLKS